MRGASRLVLRSGDEVFVTLGPAAVAAIIDEAARVAAVFVALPLLPREEDGRIGTVHVRSSAVDAIEPLDPVELEAHRRDRESWIEHG
jgi:hypothetical protein